MCIRDSLQAVHDVLTRARDSKSGRPRLVVAHTLIGKGIPEVEGTQKAHGEAGAKFVAEARKRLGLPAEPYWVAPEVRAHFEQRKAVLADAHHAWKQTFAAWQAKNPELAKQLD